MEIAYRKLEDELLGALESNHIWVLATTDGSIVSARSMSIVSSGLDIYFQTHRDFKKMHQISENGNVALCFSNISIEGEAFVTGSWEDVPEIKEIYISHHPRSYELYGKMPGQVVVKVVPRNAVFWKYINGEPVREFLYITEKRAERLVYFDQYPRGSTDVA
jgi:general stress protein 26